MNSQKQDAVSDTIRPAACIVLVERTGPQPHMLMGRRHANQIFLPNKWVFPGGRVDRADSDPDGDQPNRFAAAARRELREETGYVLPPSATLHPIARAITPPGRVRRYDTWFFITTKSANTTRIDEGDGELLDLNWFTLAAAQRLDLPNITRLIIDDVAGQLTAQMNTTATPPKAQQIPFYFQQNGVYQRTLIDPDCGPSKSWPLP